MQYGTSEDGLNQNSSAIYSGNDITITSTTYVIELTGLRGNTTYYVQVVATNTVKRSNTSIVRNFTTLSLMAGMSLKLKVVHSFLGLTLVMRLVMCMIFELWL